MKLSTCLMTLGLTLGVTAKPATFARRGIDDFLGIISGINDAVDGLTSLIEGYTGGPGTEVIEASNELVAQIRQGVEIANAQPELTTTEGFRLTQPVLDLTKDVENVIGLLIEKKELSIENGIASTVKQNLNDQYDAATALAEAISAKMPAALQDLAKQLADGVSNAIKKGVDAYADVPDATPTDGPQPTETDGPQPTESEDAEPTESEDAQPTETDCPEPTDDAPQPTDDAPQPTDDAPGATSTVTVTVTDCGGVVPTPTPSLPPIPTFPTGTGSFSAPNPPAPTGTAPPQFDSAGVVNKVSGVGALAALAVVLAF
ncbi:hypothetical protein VTO42DRAFT_5838 [Malbranchea cinnamomea]